MCENEAANLDGEFKRYLHILRPYLGQLMEQEDIETCNAWVQKLTNCPDAEKALRNRYVFQLCYQLSKGILENPFLKTPPEGALEPLPEISDSESSTEVEYFIYSAEPSTRVLFNNRRPIVSDTDYLSQENEYVDQQIDNGSDFEVKMPSPRSFHTVNPPQKQTVICYTCPQIIRDNHRETLEDEYGFRANNLIMKLREIKQQNMQLHNELMALKEETKPAPVTTHISIPVTKIDNSTNASLEDNPTWQSLMNKITEFQDIRNSLVETITTLKGQLDNYDEVKKIEIEEIVAKHKTEITKVKSTAQDEIKQIYDKKMDELRQYYENVNQLEMQNLSKMKEEHNKILNEKNTEITSLKQQLDDQKNNLQTLLTKLVDKPNEEINNENFRIKAMDLEKRLNKVERSKAKCVKSYEAKIAYLQREKHLTDCSFQLQLTKQRAQVVNEITEEHQIELNTTLDKLETKYKDIVANMQATAIQRRLQDQAALESILQAACNIKNENIYYTTFSQMSGKSPKDANQSYDSDASGGLHQKMNHKISYGESSIGPGYCLDSERLGELFEKVYIPQRDIGDYKDISVNKS